MKKILIAIFITFLLVFSFGQKNSYAAIVSCATCPRLEMLSCPNNDPTIPQCTCINRGLAAGSATYISCNGTCIGLPGSGGCNGTIVTGPGGGTGTGGTSGNGPSLRDISNFLNNPPGDVPQTGYNNILNLGITLLIIAAIFLSLFFLIWSGLDWMTSGGDKQKLNQARQKLMFAIIGLVVVFLAFFVVSVITNFFNIGGFRLPQPPNAHIGGK